MGRSTVAEFVYPVDRHGLGDGLPRSGSPSTDAIARPLSGRAATAAVLLLSFALWAAIWAVVASLTSHAPG